MSAKDYMKLAQKFSINFYLKHAIPDLEKRLTQLINDTDFNKKSEDTTKKYTEKATTNLQSDILNRGLLYELLETGDAKLEIKDDRGQVTETKDVKGLKNIDKPELIERLFEFIFIMLKLKLLDKQVEDIDKAQVAVEAPIVEAPIVQAPVTQGPIVEAPVVEQAPIIKAPIASAAPVVKKLQKKMMIKPKI